MDQYEAPAEALRLLPVQLVETDDGVVLKRGATTLAVRGEHAAETVSRVLADISEGLPREELLQRYAEPERERVDSLIDALRARRLLVRDEPGAGGPESNLDVFYWNFGTTAAASAARLDAGRIVVLGVNEISRRLVAALAASGASAFEVVDYHLLRNVGAFDEDGQLVEERWGHPDHQPIPYDSWSAGLEPDETRVIVATSDFGPTPAIRDWNAYCVASNWHFLPVVLHDLIGYVGPLVVPGQTACYECLRARQNSHLKDPGASRAAEQGAFEGQPLRGFHPSMASLLGDLAAAELTKFYGGLSPWRVGDLIEFNLMGPSLHVRKVLKVPRCGVCGTMRTRPSTNLLTSVYRLNE